jgi:hypothetical protein
MPAQLEIFSGWKEIANYLRKGVRTVQRYERDLHLPIHRPSGESNGSVIAIKAELDSWVAAAPVRRDSILKSWPAARTNKLGAEFLQIDSEIALTFSALALDARDMVKKRRTAQTARRAYDTIMRLRKGIDLTPAEEEKLDANLRRLEIELESLNL